MIESLFARNSIEQKNLEIRRRYYPRVMVYIGQRNNLFGCVICYIALFYSGTRSNVFWNQIIFLRVTKFEDWIFLTASCSVFKVLYRRNGFQRNLHVSKTYICDFSALHR